MESEYKSSYGSFYTQQPTYNISERFQNKNVEKVENNPNSENINNEESNFEQKYDPEYLIQRYFKVHPEKDQVGFRKFYDKVKKVRDPEKTTYKEFFNKSGAYFPKISDYMEAINNMAQIVETDESERQNLFSERIKREQKIEDVSPKIVDEDKKTEAETQPIKEEDKEEDDEFDYTPAELSINAINYLRKKGFNRKHSPGNLFKVKVQKGYGY